jgi:phage tail-like protein
MNSPLELFIRTKPLQSHRFFILFITNSLLPIVFDTRFNKVSGFNVSLAEREIKAGGERKRAHKSVVNSSPKYGELTLSRGYSVTNFLGRKVSSILVEGRQQSFTMFLSIMGESGIPLTTWRFERARPVKWSLSDLDADNSGAIIESLSLSYERFERIG